MIVITEAIAFSIQRSTHRPKEDFMYKIHSIRVLAIGLCFLLLGILLSSCSTSKPGKAPVAHSGPGLPRVGIVNAMGMEQAPILAAMHVTGSVRVDGYRFYLGTIGGVPVVEVRSGEKEYAAELTTALMDLHFHIRAALLTGTAGSRNPEVNVGDVVVSGDVVDKSSIHFHDRGFLSPYTGVEIRVTSRTDIKGALIGGHGAVGPTPKDAFDYGAGPSATTKHYVYVEDLAAPKELVSTALAHAPALGTTSLADATGNTKATGSIPAKVLVGVIGSANQWTEPLVDQEIQNALYESDAGENEGMGFAYANAQLGVDWLIIRGISDSPWYPNAYEGVLAADRAAAVGVAVVEHLPAHISRNPTPFSLLSPQSNAARAGYIVARKVQVTPSGIPTEITYINQAGKKVTEPWPFVTEYRFSAGTAQDSLSWEK
jgi:adenosylhomocysteine nucleosidase